MPRNLLIAHITAEPVRPGARFQQLLAETRPRWEAVVAWEQRL